MAQEKAFPIKVSRIQISIKEGDPVIFYKNFNKDNEPSNLVYYFKAFRNTNSFRPDAIRYTIEEKLSHHGFNVEGWGGLFPELNETVEPKLAIGVIIKDFAIYNNTLYTKLEIESLINWQILDLETNQIVYNQELSSTYYTEKIIIQTSNAGVPYYDYSRAIDSAFTVCVNQLLNDSVFKSLFIEDGLEYDLNADTSKIVIPQIALSKTSGYLEQAIQGTVTIKSPLGFGSGFFLSREGLILSCYHNIKKSRPVKVFLNKGVSMEAEVVKVNPEYDLALLKLKEVESKALMIGQNSTEEIGREVFVIGTPANQALSQSVSKGIISGDRIIEEKRYLQTDASVSPGNSGGPMINKDGEVIGIVNAKVVSFGTEGIGFAIPIDIALEQLNIQIK